MRAQGGDKHRALTNLAMRDEWPEYPSSKGLTSSSSTITNYGDYDYGNDNGNDNDVDNDIDNDNDKNDDDDKDNDNDNDNDIR